MWVDGEEKFSSTHCELKQLFVNIKIGYYAHYAPFFFDDACNFCSRAIRKIETTESTEDAECVVMAYFKGSA